MPSVAKKNFTSINFSFHFSIDFLRFIFNSVWQLHWERFLNENLIFLRQFGCNRTTSSKFHNIGLKFCKILSIQILELCLQNRKYEL
jgi:hypothetical protein